MFCSLGWSGAKRGLRRASEEPLIPAGEHWCPDPAAIRGLCFFPMGGASWGRQWHPPRSISTGCRLQRPGGWPWLGWLSWCMNVFTGALFLRNSPDLSPVSFGMKARANILQVLLMRNSYILRKSLEKRHFANFGGIGGEALCWIMLKLPEVAHMCFPAA